MFVDKSSFTTETKQSFSIDSAAGGPQTYLVGSSGTSKHCLTFLPFWPILRQIQVTSTQATQGMASEQSDQGQ